jgi:hypothetical protein
MCCYLAVIWMPVNNLMKSNTQWEPRKLWVNIILEILLLPNLVIQSLLISYLAF